MAVDDAIKNLRPIKNVTRRTWKRYLTSVICRLGLPYLFRKTKIKRVHIKQKGLILNLYKDLAHRQGKLQFFVSTQLTGFLKSSRIALSMLLRASLKSPGETKSNI